MYPVYGIRFGSNLVSKESGGVPTVAGCKASAIRFSALRRERAHVRAPVIGGTRRISPLGACWSGYSARPQFGANTTQAAAAGVGAAAAPGADGNRLRF